MTDELFDYTDGNELAGPLAEIFAVDLTTSVSRCAHCGRTTAVASLRVYNHRSPGWVARCPGCAEVMLRLVRAPDAAWLDLRGTSVLRIPMVATVTAAGHG
jgi:hypothetical protein